MQTNMHNVFLYCGHPNILGNFLLFAGQNQLGENYLTYSHIWGGGGGPEYFRLKNTLHIRGIPAPPNKSCMRQFPPAW